MAFAFHAHPPTLQPAQTGQLIGGTMRFQGGNHRLTPSMVMIGPFTPKVCSAAVQEPFSVPDSAPRAGKNNSGAIFGTQGPKRDTKELWDAPLESWASEVTKAGQVFASGYSRLGPAPLLTDELGSCVWQGAVLLWVLQHLANFHGT